MLNESQISDLGCICQSFSAEELGNLSIASLDTLETMTTCNFTQTQVIHKFNHQTASRIYIYIYIYICVTLDHKTSLKSLGYICSNSQKYIVWVKIIVFFMPIIIRTLSKDHVP